MGRWVVAIREGYVSHPHQRGLVSLAVEGLVVLLQGLISALRTDGDHHPATRFELLKKSLGYHRCSGAYVDRVVRCVGEVALAAVAADQHHLPRLEQAAVSLVHVCDGEVHEPLDVIDADGVTLWSHHSCHCRHKIPRAGADVEEVSTLGKMLFQVLEAVRVHVRCANRRPEPDPLRRVFVRASC